jgi:hypothetical protein
LLVFKSAIWIGASNCTTVAQQPALSARHTTGTTADESCKQSSKNLRLFYLEFEAQTLSPVTSSNINRSSKTCVLETPEQGAALMKLLARGRQPANPFERFFDAAVRLKVVAANNEECVFALVEGSGVVRQGPVDQVLSEEAVHDLERWLVATCHWPEL